MTTLNEKVREYMAQNCGLTSNDGYYSNIHNSYLAGYTEALRWRDVIRDKHGFTTDECLNDIFEHEQVLFLMSDGSIDAMSANHDKAGWRGELERNINYVKYRPIETI